MKKLLLIVIAIALLGATAYFYGNEEEVDVVVDIDRTKLVGTWQSTDDPLSKVVFNTDGSQQDVYDNKVLGSGSWSFYEQESDVFLRTVINEETYEYAILEISEENLTLSYLSRGNILNYKRVVNSTEGFSQYISLENGFAIKHPSDWEVQEALKPQETKAFHEVYVSKNDGLGVVVRMFENPEELSVKEWWGAWLAEEDLKKEDCNIEESPCLFLRDLIEGEKDTKLDEKEALEITLFRFDHQEVCTYADSVDYIYGVCATGTNPNDESEFENRMITKSMTESFELVHE